MAASGPDHIASAPTDSSIALAEERLWELLTTGRISGEASSASSSHSHNAVAADIDDPPDPEPEPIAITTLPPPVPKCSCGDRARIRCLMCEEPICGKLACYWRWCKTCGRDSVCVFCARQCCDDMSDDQQWWW